MKEMNKRSFRCAIYTRVSTNQGLEQDFNSLDAQREASEAYIKSQAHEGWRLMRDRYDDGGYSGGSMERPALQKLLADIEARRIDVIVVYKVDRLTRSPRHQDANSLRICIDNQALDPLAGTVLSSSVVSPRPASSR